MGQTQVKTFGKGSLTKRYDYHAATVLRALRYIGAGPSEDQGHRWSFTVYKELPTVDEYHKMRDKHFSTSIKDAISDLENEATELQSEVQDWYDGLSEGLQSTEKADALMEAADSLSNVVSYIEDASCNCNEDEEDYPNEFKEMNELKIVLLPNKVKGKYPSRNYRVQQMITNISVIVDALSGLENSENAFDNITSPLNDASSDLESVDIPGMY